MAKSRTGSQAPSLTATMKAAAIDRFGGPEVLTLHTLPVPTPDRQEVLIAVHVAGVGVWDTSIRDGSWRLSSRPKFPLVPGTDGAGIIVAKGAGVRRFRVGERVYATRLGGFYAEYVAVNEQYAGRVPEPLDMLQAGAAAVTGLTALQGVDDALQVKKGDTLLIFGASGAVGTLAVQFAKRRRVRVLATASGRNAASLVQELGADAVFDPRKTNFIEQLRALIDGGLDAVLALAGGEALEQCLDHVRAGGPVAYPHGVEPEPRRRPGIRLTAYDAEAGPPEFVRLQRAVVEAKLRVPIARVYPLSQAAKAHVRLERGHILGRIVLQVRREST
jgi:NADPH2:quinone reductase